MAAWGTGLLENDVAEDARQAFDDVAGSGESVDVAIRAVLEEWDDDPAEDDRADLILALAWLVAERGPVPDGLAAEARQVIRDRTVLDRWEVTLQHAERQAVECLLLDVLDGRATHPGRRPAAPPPSRSGLREHGRQDAP